MAVSLLNPDQKQYVLDELTKGTSYADISTAIVAQGVDKTWFDALETVTMFAWRKLRARQVDSPTSDQTRYRAAVTPVVSSISPATFDIAAGQEAIIVGTGFVPGCTVTIGGHACTVVANCDTLLHIIMPAHAAEIDQHIIVTNPNTNTGEKADAVVRAKQTPLFTSINPATSRIDGGTKCVIVGTVFTPGMTVAIGGHACEVISQDGTTKITIEVPAHAAGALDVVITAANGDSATGSGAFTYVA
jgi:hypothetical protein